MTTATAERRRALFADGQESLFGGETLAPNRPAAPWERREAPARDECRQLPTRDEHVEARVHEERPEARVDEERREAPVREERPAARVREERREAPMREERPEARVREDRPVAPAPETIVGDDLRAPRTVGAPLTGPTLDDVMSRVWEGLVTGLPAACPVCRGEVVPSLGGPPSGRCSSCATMID